MVRLAAPQSQPDDIEEAIRQGQAMRAWNLMGGEIQWSALDRVAEVVGASDDVDMLTTRLEAISAHVNRKPETRDDG